MPTSLLRALVILLLAVAVPLQGYAAAGIEPCEAFARGGDQAVTAAAVQAHHLAEAAGADRDAYGSPDGRSAQDSHYCPACASCGVAAAISAAPALYASDTPYRGVVIVSLPAPEGHVPEGLDRPPLTLLV